MYVLCIIFNIMKFDGNLNRKKSEFWLFLLIKVHWLLSIIPVSGMVYF